MADTSGSPRLGEDLPRGAGWIAFAAFSAFALVGLAIRLPDDPPLAAGAALVALGAGALLVLSPRRLVPGYAALAAAGVAVLAHGSSSNVGWFALCVLGGWCVLAGGRGEALAFWLATLALLGAEWLWVQPDPGWGAWMAGVTFTVLGALLVRRERDLVAQLRAAQAGLADRARAEERNRIAREVHDVIAHSLTVSLLHVSSARLAVEYDPDDAVRALTEAERLGRESLAEVRSAVGLLHRDGEARAGADAPLPGLAAVPSLVERFRSAGAEVALTIDGDPHGLPATAGLAVYRILQEALTNAARHAPGAAVRIELDIGAAAVGLVVESAGRPTRGSGLGLLSMRERAEALGGTCRAGPGGDGWRVEAAVPLPAGRERGVAT